jgi:hypothetical protein
MRLISPPKHLFILFLTTSFSHRPSCLIGKTKPRLREMLKFSKIWSSSQTIRSVQIASGTVSLVPIVHPSASYITLEPDPRWASWNLCVLHYRFRSNLTMLSEASSCAFAAQAFIAAWERISAASSPLISISGHRTRWR